jgi:site-specific DNA-methyltransferase (adenine-specific)
VSVQLLHGDCLEQFLNIPDKSVDLVLTDPPYGTTACKWDSVIPFEPLWKQVWLVLKPNGAAVFTASQPFTSALVMSQIEAFKYCWVWEKSAATGHLNAKRMPMKMHEDVAVFFKEVSCYNPQGLLPFNKKVRRGGNGDNFGVSGTENFQEWTNYPRSILRFPHENKAVHPTQKPVALMEYLIKTYTNEGDTVLDFTMGSGTTGVAAKNLGRNFIGIERDEKYFQIAKNRIGAAA